MASSSSIIKRWIHRKATSILSPNNNNSRTRCVMINKDNRGALSSSINIRTSKSSSKLSSPWLMLPPSYEWHNKDNMVFNFYSLSDDKIVTSSGHKSVGRSGDHIEVVSSSHGWISLCNTHDSELFLFNPISGTKIPLQHLPYDTVSLQSGSVRKLITSCSPEQDDCRLMMSYGLHQTLAFCSPNSDDNKWIPIGNPYFQANRYYHPVPRPYQDFVYSSRQKLFFCVDRFQGFEAWDLQDASCPKMIELNPSCNKEDYPYPARSKEEARLETTSFPLIFLVVAEESGDVFWVRRQVLFRMALDGSYPFSHDLNEDYQDAPYKTIGFDVHKYHQEKCELVYMDGSLDGLAFFIGNNHSFALSPTEFPELKPNSIYFTDVSELIVPNVLEYRPLAPYGGHDLGIYNYEDRTFSPCYYPCDRQSIQQILPAPMWFTPTN